MRRPRHTAPLRLLTAALAAAVLLGVRCAEAQRAPNIVFIMADDLGYGHLGAYGQRRIETPNVDGLAAEGMRFTQVYAGAPVCAPSRSVLMTGLHGGHTPVRGNSGGIPLRDEDVTVAELLKQGGYATGVFGKWGLGEYGTAGMPTRQGFDEFLGYLHQIHAHFYYPEYLWKNEARWPLPGNLGGGRLPADAGGERTQYAPDEAVAHAVNFIRANQDRPFFLYVPTVIPHVEVVAPEASVRQYEGRFEEQPCDDPRPGYADPRRPRATYAAMISHMDRNVGRILSALEELGLEDDTIVFFTSDNGAQGGYCASPEFFEASGPLRGYKRSMYEGGLRVPMIVRWPGRVEAGAVSDHVWHFADVLPTLADAAGVPVPDGLDGHSVWPALVGEAAAGRPRREHEVLYWELATGSYGRSGDLMQAVRIGDWKGVRNSLDGPTELYDLRHDLGETRNVAAEHPEVVARIERCFRDCRTAPRPQVEPVKVQGRPYR